MTRQWQAKYCRRGLMLLLSALVAACSGAGAGTNDSGGSTAPRSVARVNQYAVNDQQLPALACNATGACVAAWDSVGQDGSLSGIYARLYGENGQARGDEFRVNIYTRNRQTYPAVAIDAQGEFVVAWVSERQGNNGFSLHARLYSASGTPQGDSFRVDEADNSGHNVYPQLAVAMNDDGQFVVVWGERQIVLGGLKMAYVMARAYTATGKAQTAPLTVTFGLSPLPRAPVVAMNGNGGFLVVWDSDGTGAGSGIHAQRYSATGLASGLSFRVDDSAAGTLVDHPVVAMNQFGTTVIAWETLHADLRPAGIMARRYAAAGAALGSPFAVGNALTLQRFPSVAMDSAGDSLIVATGNQGIGAWFQTASEAVTTFRVDRASLPTSVLYPVAALRGVNRFLVIWQHFTPDVDSRDIEARAFQAGG